MEGSGAVKKIKIVTDPDPRDLKTYGSGSGTQAFRTYIGCGLLAQPVHQGGDVGQPRPHTECRLQREDRLLRPPTGQIAHT
jgi:hypothetical protein